MIIQIKVSRQTFEVQTVILSITWIGKTPFSKLVLRNCKLKFALILILTLTVICTTSCNKSNSLSGFPMTTEAFYVKFFYKYKLICRVFFLMVYSMGTKFQINSNLIPSSVFNMFKCYDRRMISI